MDLKKILHHRVTIIVLTLVILSGIGVGAYFYLVRYNTTLADTAAPSPSVKLQPIYTYRQPVHFRLQNTSSEVINVPANAASIWVKMDRKFGFVTAEGERAIDFPLDSNVATLQPGEAIDFTWDQQGNCGYFAMVPIAGHTGEVFNYFENKCSMTNIGSYSAKIRYQDASGANLTAKIPFRINPLTRMEFVSQNIANVTFRLINGSPVDINGSGTQTNHLIPVIITNTNNEIVDAIDVESIPASGSLDVVWHIYDRGIQPGNYRIYYPGSVATYLDVTI